MTKASIDRFLNQKLVFNPAGAGISDLQKDYRRFLGILGLLARSSCSSPASTSPT